MSERENFKKCLRKLFVKVRKDKNPQRKSHDAPKLKVKSSKLPKEKLNKKIKLDLDNDEDFSDESNNTVESFRINESLRMAADAKDLSLLKTKNRFFKCLSGAVAANIKTLDKAISYALEIVGTELDDEDFRDIREFWKLVKQEKSKFKKLSKNDEIDSKKVGVFKALVFGLALSTIQQPKDLNLFTDEIQELDECLQRCIKDVRDKNEPYWADVLLDFMLSHLSKESPFMASLMLLIFRNFAHEVTSEGIQQLKIALLTQSLDADDESNSDENNDLSEDDAEMRENSDNDNGVDEQFRNQVQLALGPAATFDPDASEVDLDDEEMFQLDEALADAFRSKFGQSKEKSKNTENLRYLHAKCLDFVKVIFKLKTPNFEIITELAETLLKAAKLYHNTGYQLKVKIFKIIASIPPVKTLDFEKVEPQVDKLKSIFKNTVEVCNSIQDGKVQQSAAKLCVWVTSLCLQKSMPIDWITESTTSVLHEFFQKPNCGIGKSFIVALLQKNQIYSPSLLSNVAFHVFSNLRPFKKAEGLFILNFCLRNLQELSENPEIKDCIIAIKDRAVDGFSDALQSRKLIILNEYFPLLYIISKHSEVILSTESVKSMESLPKSLTKGLSKNAKLSRKTLLSFHYKKNHISRDEILQSIKRAKSMEESPKKKSRKSDDLVKNPFFNDLIKREDKKTIESSESPTEKPTKSSLEDSGTVNELQQNDNSSYNISGDDKQIDSIKDPNTFNKSILPETSSSEVNLDPHQTNKELNFSTDRTSTFSPLEITSIEKVTETQNSSSKALSPKVSSSPLRNSNEEAADNDSYVKYSPKPASNVESSPLKAINGHSVPENETSSSASEDQLQSNKSPTLTSSLQSHVSHSDEQKSVSPSLKNTTKSTKTSDISLDAKKLLDTPKSSKKRGADKFKTPVKSSKKSVSKSERSIIAKPSSPTKDSEKDDFTITPVPRVMVSSRISEHYLKDKNGPSSNSKSLPRELKDLEEYLKEDEPNAKVTIGGRSLRSRTAKVNYRE